MREHSKNHFEVPNETKKAKALLKIPKKNHKARLQNTMMSIQAGDRVMFVPPALERPMLYE
jgi:hypothetical protein